MLRQMLEPLQGDISHFVLFENTKLRGASNIKFNYFTRFNDST